MEGTNIYLATVAYIFAFIAAILSVQVFRK